MSEDPLTTDPNAMHFKAPQPDEPLDPMEQLSPEQRLLLQDPEGLIPANPDQLQPSAKVNEQSEPWQDAVMNQSYLAARRLWENKELEHQTKHDELTGLLNQAGFYEKLEQQIDGAEDESFALLAFDLTNFKRVNDEKGHVMGDAVLKDFATFLREHTRKGNGIPGDELSYFGESGRTGGDEFMGIFNLQPRKDSSEADKELTPQQRVDIITDNLLGAWSNFLGTRADLEELGFDMSVGASLYKKGMTSDELKDAANQSMREHKDIQHATLGKYREA